MTAIVVPVADLQITKTDGSSTYMPGQTLVYTVVVTNAGPSNVTGATISDSLPSGVASATWTATQTGGASGFAASGSGGISTTADMPASSTITYTITMVVATTKTGDLVETATVTPPPTVMDPNLNNNTATDTDVQLSIVPGFPLITGNNISKTATTYTPGTDSFTFSSIPAAMGPVN